MRARKVDANLSVIVSAARAAGFMVNVRNDDFADLDVQLHGWHEAWECKGLNGRPTNRQRELAARGWKIRTVRTVDDVLAAKKWMMGRMK